MQPIKTEYKGIVFDSKSEAMFARTLDLIPVIDSWDYHPPKFITGSSHDFDFLVDWDAARQRLLIEYKPKRPTNTYLRNLIEKLRDEETIGPAFVVYGSPYDYQNTGRDEDCYCMISIDRFYASFSGIFGFDYNMYLSVMKYRYDLA